LLRFVRSALGVAPLAQFDRHQASGLAMFEGTTRGCGFALEQARIAGESYRLGWQASGREVEPTIGVHVDEQLHRIASGRDIMENERLPRTAHPLQGRVPARRVG